MNTQPKQCPFCGENLILSSSNTIKEKYKIVCHKNNCFSSKRYSSRKEAIRAMTYRPLEAALQVTIDAQQKRIDELKGAIQYHVDNKMGWDELDNKLYGLL